MPYKDPEKQKEYWKDKKRKDRMSTPTLSTPEDVHPEMSTPQVVKQDGSTGAYDPQTDGIDGWHFTGLGRAYIHQRSFGGVVRRYGPGGLEMSYYDPPVLERAQGQGWRHFKDYIGKDSARLEGVKRIAGSLGKYQSEVFFGLGGLTVKDISEVIGELPPLYAHPGR